MRAVLSLFYLLFLGFSLAGLAEGAQLKVSVPAEATATSDKVTLGDIAKIEGEDQGQVNEIKSLLLTQLSSSAQSKIISRAMIVSILKRSRVEMNEMDFTAPETIDISRNMMKVEAQFIEERAKEFLQEYFQERTGEASITNIVCQEKDLSLPQGNLEVSFPPFNRTPGTGTVFIHAHLLVDGKLAKKVKVVAQVNITEEMAVATRAIEKGDILTPADFTMETRVANRENPKLLRDPEEVLGKRAIRRISSGSFIQENMLDTPPLVKKKDQVKIVLESKFLKISTIGIAQENGAMGNYIQVMNLDSQKLIAAKVIGENLVKVDF